MADPVTGTAAAYLLASSGKAGEVDVTVVVTKAAEGLIHKIEDSVNKKWNGSEAVSYTHLTLPTNTAVSI